jgi:septal ring factor EnvC (AmiA/AmiB activator)
VTRAEVGAQTTLVEAKRVSQARWRFAATVLAASLVAAAFTGMYFRAQVTYEVAQLRKAANANAAELQQERDHSAALESELATVRRDFETTAALSSKAADEGARLRKVADANAAELQQERDQRAALASELATVRRDFETMAALSSKAADEGAQLRKVADANAAELQQERDHSAALASELATVRRDFETTAALSSKAADEGAQLRKVADANAAELQQERDHSAALASELATVRRDFETTAALSSKAADEGARLRKVADAKAELKREPDRTASLQGRASAAGAPVAAPPARKLDPDELATLMNRAKILVAAGDISAARLLLERAAEAQEPTAALMLARTYDPDVLRTENVRNIIPDPAMARIWYQRAAQLGSADAQRRLSQWEN